MVSLDQVADYFLYLDSQQEGEGISNLKLQKLAYYAQGFHLAIFGKPLFEEEIEAWTHGPVIPELYHNYKEHGAGLIPNNPDFDPQIISSDERELIDEVFEVFGQFSAWKLRNMTHEERPWLDNESIAEVISKKELTDYFETRVN